MFCNAFISKYIKRKKQRCTENDENNEVKMKREKMKRMKQNVLIIEYLKWQILKR